MRWKFIFRVSRDNSLAQGLRRRRGFHLIRGGTPHPARFAAHLPLEGKALGGAPLKGKALETRAPRRGRLLGDGEGRADEKAPGGRASSGAVHNVFFI